jgi:hypothetical protein
MLKQIGLAILEALANSQNQENERMKKDIYYRTKDGRADYGFSFEEQNDGSLRAYIKSMPGYGSRSTNPLTTHRLSDGGRNYVCWSEKIHSEEELKAVVASWSDKTQEYIKTGVTIDEQVRRGR